MTTSETKPVQCPICGSDSLTRWNDLDSWVCDDCAYVIKKRASESEVVRVASEFERQEKVSKNGNWKERVSVKDSSEANLVSVLSLIEDFAEEFILSDDVVLRAAELITEAWESNFMHGRKKEDAVAATVFAASKESLSAIPPGILAEYIGSNSKKVMRTFKQLREELQLDTKPSTPHDYVDYICRGLDAPENVNTYAKKTLNEERSTPGNPIGVAAGSVYNAMCIYDKQTTLREIASVTRLTKETIWRHSAQLRPN